MSTIEDQPPPIPNNREPSWRLVMDDVRRFLIDPYKDVAGVADQVAIVERVVADMAERDLIGRERYGTPLQAGNGRKHLVDAYQEQLDYIVYLRTELAELGLTPWLRGIVEEDDVSFEIAQRGTAVHSLYMMGLTSLMTLRTLIP